MKNKEVIKGYKMFNSDFTCRGKKYAVGKKFRETGEIKCCKNGLHFCVNPFDCLDYYDLFDENGKFNKICEVTGTGRIDKEIQNNDIKKVAVSNLEVIKELSLKDFINNGIEFIQDNCKNEIDKQNDGYSAQIGSSGDSAQIVSSGKNSVICCAGHNCQVKGKIGSWITLAEWKIIDNEYKPVCVKTEYIDGERIKEDVFYQLKDGKFVEYQND